MALNIPYKIIKRKEKSHKDYIKSFLNSIGLILVGGLGHEWGIALKSKKKESQNAIYLIRNDSTTDIRLPRTIRLPPLSFYVVTYWILKSIANRF